MTACVNKNHGRRVAGVVTASLVGALTLGGVSLAAVPTVALAEQGSLQSVGSLDSSTLYTYKTSPSATDAVTVNANYIELRPGSGYVRPETVLVDGEEVNVQNSNYTLTYSLNGTTVAGNVQTAFASAADGDLASVTIKPGAGAALKDGTPVTGELTINFKYVAKTSDVTYKIGTTDAGTFSEGLTYTGVEQTPTVKASDGSAVTVTGVTDAAGKAPTDITAGSTNVFHAGSYVAQLSNGESVPFEVAKLDLSQAKLSAADVKTPYTDITLFSANDSLSKITSAVDVKSVTGPKGAGVWNGGYGEYTVVLKAKDGQKSSDVSGEATVKYTVCNDLAYAGYDGAVTSAFGPTKAFNINGATGDKWDASKLFVTVEGKNYRGDALEVTYKHGNESVEAADLVASATPYTVTVRLKPVTVNGKIYGGTTTFTVTVQDNTLDADKALTYRLDDKVVKGTTPVTYDGSDALKQLTVEVKDADGKVYAQGTDYKVVAYKQGDTETQLDSVTEVGKYDVYVVPTTFQWADAAADDLSAKAKLTIDVQPANLTNPAGDADSDGFTDSAAKFQLNDYVSSVYGYAADGSKVTENDSVVYTGSDIEVPVVKFVSKTKDVKVFKSLDSAGKVTGSATSVKVPTAYTELPSDAYTVSNIRYTDGDGNSKTVETIKDAGTYKVSIQATDKGQKNYGFTGLSYTVTVRKAHSFTDVAADKWYAKPVEDAFQQFYVNGTSGTVLFTPEADITRADAVGILYNMAGGPKVTDDLVTEDKGYATGFSDVDSHVYYAQALAWAHKVGVANGYADGTFAPNAKITRQEFAAFLMNYAKATGKYAAATEDKLSGMSDAFGVDAWATEAVNWAVSNKVMGNGGYVAATSNISRAEVAAMAVNYQPKALVSDVNGVKPGERVH